MKLIRQHAPNAIFSHSQRVVTGDIWIDTPLFIMAASKKAEAEGGDQFTFVKQTLRRVTFQALAVGNNQLRWVFDGRTRQAKSQTVQTRIAASDAYTKRCAVSANASRENKFGAPLALGHLLQKSNETLRQFSITPQSIFIAEVEEPDAPEPQSHKVPYRELVSFAKTAIQEISEKSVIEQALHDSEEFIARHMKSGDLAITSDSDALTFGCSAVVQNFGSASEAWIYLDKLLEDLGLTLEQFRYLGVLLGNDFNDRVPKQGPVASFAAVKKENFSLETYAQEKTAPPTWLSQAQSSYAIFSGH